MKFTPFPEIKTERLLLRKTKLSDSDIILFLRSDADVTKFIERPENKKIKNIPDAIKLLKNLDIYLETTKSITWGITLNNESQLIGTICLWNFSDDYKTAEVGYDLVPKHQNNGIMSEALNTIVEFGFNELKLDKIEAFTHVQNENSKRLLNKHGFNLNEIRKDQGNKSNVIFEITRS